MAVWSQVSPYISYVNLTGHKHKPDDLLPAIKRIGDEVLYWTVFFQIGDPQKWNQELLALLKQNMSDEDLWEALWIRLPAQDEHNYWLINLFG